MRRFVVLALPLVLLPACGTQQSDGLSSTASAPSPSTSPAQDPRIPGEGSRVAATGRVERLEGRAPRLCDPTILRTLGKAAPEEDPAPCLGIEVEGLTAPADAVVRVEGVLQGAVLVADREQPPADEEPRVGLPDVPCKPPDGGWPDGGAPYDDRSPDDGATTRFNEAHPDLAASGRVMLLRPTPNRTVATVVVRDEAERQRVEAELAPDFPGRACVVVQAGDVEVAVRAQHDERLTQERLMRGAWTDWAPDLQTRFARVQVERLTPLMLEVERDYPEGTLVLEPWLTVLGTA